MEVFDDMDSLTRSELGLSAQHEGPDFYLSLLRQAEQDRLLEKQVKKHGMDHGLDKVGSKEPGTTVSTDGTFSRFAPLPRSPEMKDDTKEWGVAFIELQAGMSQRLFLLGNEPLERPMINQPYVCVVELCCHCLNRREIDRPDFVDVADAALRLR
jgi:hypothetical protein